MRVLSYFSLLLLQYAMGDLSRLPCESECASSTHCSPTFWGATIAQSRARSAGCEVILYTVSTEPNTRRIVPGPADNVGCNIAFVAEGTVRNTAGFANWTLVHVNSTNSSQQFPNARKASRVPKLSPGLFFADSVKYAVYVDSILHLKVPVSRLLNWSMPADTDREVVMAVMAHSFTDNLHAEFKVIGKVRLRRPHITHQWALLQAQHKNYTEYEATHPGLVYNVMFEGSALVHNVHSPLGKKWRCDWYKEYNRWADRDQMPGCFMASKLHYQASRGSQTRSAPTNYLDTPVADGFIPIYAKEEAAAALYLFPRKQAREILVTDRTIRSTIHRRLSL